MAPASKKTSSKYTTANSTNSVYTKGLWGPDEDEVLLKLVHRQLCEAYERDAEGSNLKSIMWQEISRGVGTRSVKQCRERWVNHLSPHIRKDPWSPEEDQVLLTLSQRHPRKWALIARSLPGRTQNHVKIRWTSLKRRERKASLSKQLWKASRCTKPLTADNKRKLSTTDLGIQDEFAPKAKLSYMPSRKFTPDRKVCQEDEIMPSDYSLYLPPVDPNAPQNLDCLISDSDAMLQDTLLELFSTKRTYSTFSV